MSDTLSFETGEGGSFGDLLSTRPVWPERVRVGLLACGYFEYWRMFSPAFQQRVRANVERIAQRLAQDFELVFPGVVDTLDAAEQAGAALAEARVELVVVVEGTYAPDYLSLQALGHVEGVPLVLFTTQEAADITPEDDYETAMRNSALIGTAQLSGSLRKMGREFSVVVGAMEDSEPYAEIGRLARAVRVARRLRSLTIGVLGHVFRGMYDLENDKTKIKGALGPNVIYVELEHLLRQWEQVSEEETGAATEAWAGRFRLRGTTREEVAKSVRVGLAMERLVEHLRLNALCFLGQHYLEKALGAPARLGASMLMEKGEHLAACEGDLAGLALSQAMHWLNGASPLQAEWGQYDASHNALFLLGHGVASPTLSVSPEAVSITGAPEEWGFVGAGANLEFILAPGQVTLAHLLDSAEGWQMLLTGGESLAYPCLPCGEIHALVQIERPVREYLVEIQEWGVTHHVIVIPGDLRRELRHLARLLKIRCGEF